MFRVSILKREPLPGINPVCAKCSKCSKADRPELFSSSHLPGDLVYVCKIVNTNWSSVDNHPESWNDYNKMGIFNMKYSNGDPYMWAGALCCHPNHLIARKLKLHCPNYKKLLTIAKLSQI